MEFTNKIVPVVKKKSFVCMPSIVYVLWQSNQSPSFFLNITGSVTLRGSNGQLGVRDLHDPGGARVVPI